MDKGEPAGTCSEDDKTLARLVHIQCSALPYDEVYSDCEFDDLKSKGKIQKFLVNMDLAWFWHLPVCTAQ